MAKTSPLQFIQQVRAEAAKVSWPTRKDTITATIMVFVMGALAAIFFLLVDEIISAFIRLVLNLGA